MSNTKQPPSITPGGNPPPEPPEPKGLAASRPGKKTTEFILAILAMVLGGVLSLGLVGHDSVYGQVIGAALALLAHLGYSTSRAVVKSSEAKATAEAIARVAEAQTRPLPDRPRSTE